MTVQRRLRFAAFMLCFTGLFVGALYYVHSAFITSWNETQLRQLAIDTVTRTELAIDSATMKMSDVIVNRSTSCATARSDGDDKSALRLQHHEEHAAGNEGWCLLEL
jgi:hypothetical protein